MKNRNKYFLQTVCFSVANLLSSGAVVQTFMLYLGISGGQVSVYTSLIQLAQVLAMLPLTILGDAVKKVRKLCATIVFLLPVIFVAFLLASSPVAKTVDAKYLVILIGSLLTNVFLGVYNVLSYKLPYYIIDMREYGTLMATGGIFSGLAGMGTTFLISLLEKKFDYLAIMTVAFVIGALLWLLSGFFISSYKLKAPVSPTVENRNAKVSFKALCKLPVFYKLLPAHVLRGVSAGIVALALVIGAHEEIIDTQAALVITFLTPIATIVGNYIYRLLAGGLGADKMLWGSAFLFAVCCPLTLAGRNVYVFYVFYFLFNAFLIVLNNCVPVLITWCVPFDMMGKYSSWRMLIYTFGLALPGFFMEPLLSSIGGVWTLLIGSALMIVACSMYAIVAVKHKLEPNGEAAI